MTINLMMRNKCVCVSNNQRLISIVLLDSSILEISIDQKTTIGEIFQKICEQLHLEEIDIFGLALRIKDEYFFPLKNEKVSKILSKSCTSVPTSPLNTLIHKNNSNTSSSSSNTFQEDLLKTCSTLYFRVQYYVTDPLLLRDQTTRYIYFSQLKNNYLTMNHNLSQEAIFKLAALLLEATHGTYDSIKHKGSYFDIYKYFPKWIINKLGVEFIYNNIAILHMEQSKLKYTKSSAQIKYCMQLSNDDTPFNTHLYYVYKNKDDLVPSICLGIAPKGIQVFELRGSDEICLISTFPWSTVTKLNCEKKKIEITLNLDSKTRRTYSYYTNCERKSKFFDELCKMTHEFTVNIFSRLADKKTLANYVTESYKETIYIQNETQNEDYEEREIGVKPLIQQQKQDQQQLKNTIQQNDFDISNEETNSNQIAKKRKRLAPTLDQQQQQQEQLQTSEQLFQSLKISPHSQTALPEEVPMKIVKSSVAINLHSAHSCCLPRQLNNNNQMISPYQQQQQQYSTFNIDYRQTFAAKTKPPPPPYNAHYAKKPCYQPINQDNYQYYSETNIPTPRSNHQLQQQRPPYVEYKKPPSYEESLERLKSHTKNLSNCSDQSVSSTMSSTYTSPFSTPQRKDSLSVNSQNNVELQTSFDNQSEITIDEQNIEQIRIKAASMSLPLLTALCSDKSLIRCLSNKQAS